MKKTTIYNSIIDLDEWQDFLEEEELLNDDFEIQHEAVFRLNEMYLEDARINLDIQLSNSILVIANIGGWNGRAGAIK